MKAVRASFLGVSFHTTREILSDHHRPGRCASQASRDVVHLWLCPVEEAPRLGEQASILAEQERARSRRFGSASRRSGFIAARVMLRQALSQVLDSSVSPDAWSIATGANGRPVLAGGKYKADFSISYCEDMIAVAIAPKRSIGIDIESEETAGAGLRGAPWRQ